MYKVYHKKIWSTGAVKIHVDPPPTPLIKSKIGFNIERYYAKIKHRIHFTSEKLDMYELKMALFDNGK